MTKKQIEDKYSVAWGIKDNYMTCVIKVDKISNILNKGKLLNS